MPKVGPWEAQRGRRTRQDRPGPVAPSPARKRHPGRHVAKKGPQLGHVAPVKRRDRVRDEGTYTLTLPGRLGIGGAKAQFSHSEPTSPFGR